MKLRRAYIGITIFVSFLMFSFDFDKNGNWCAIHVYTANIIKCIEMVSKGQAKNARFYQFEAIEKETWSKNVNNEGLFFVKIKPIEQKI